LAQYVVDYGTSPLMHLFLIMFSYKQCHQQAFTLQHTCTALTYI